MTVTSFQVPHYIISPFKSVNLKIEIIFCCSDAQASRQITKYSMLGGLEFCEFLQK